MEYSSRLNELSITKKSAEYFVENPDEYEQKIRQLNELKKEIANASLNNYHKDCFLESINNYLEMLESKSKKDDRIFNDLLLLGIGAMLGIFAKHYFDKGVDYFTDRLEKGILDGIEKGMMQI